MQDYNIITQETTEDGFTLTLATDPEPINPRTDYDPLGGMAVRRASALDAYEWKARTYCDTWEDGDGLRGHLAGEDVRVIVSLQWHEYGGGECRCSCGPAVVGKRACAAWLREQEGDDDGILYLTADDIRREYGRVDGAQVRKCGEYLESEARMLDAYAQGECYCWDIVPPEGLGIGRDSCYGYLGDREGAKVEMHAVLDHLRELLAAELAERAEMAARDIVTVT